jgi:cytochrome c oxidase subunit IV
MTDVDASPATEHESEHHDHGHHANAGHDGEHGAHDAVSDNRYIIIAVVLAVITAAEVAASYIDLGAVFIPLLLFMMAVKFFIVASFFMHLRFDNRIFTWMFYAGVFLAIGVYVAALLTFRFFEA